MMMIYTKKMGTSECSYCNVQYKWLFTVTEKNKSLNTKHMKNMKEQTHEEINEQYIK